MAYSTWKRRPSGEKVFTPLSYSDLVRYMVVLGVLFLLLWLQRAWIYGCASFT
jgi:hypothetical protein